MRLIEASTLMIQLDANSLGSPMSPSPSSPRPRHVYARCPSCHSHPNLSWLGTSTELCWIAYNQYVIFGCTRQMCDRQTSNISSKVNRIHDNKNKNATYISILWSSTVCAIVCNNTQHCILSTSDNDTSDRTGVLHNAVVIKLQLIY